LRYTLLDATAAAETRERKERQTRSKRVVLGVFVEVG
jgi:hypothetical protein